MAEIQLPWLFACDHVAAFGDYTILSGEGAFNVVTGPQVSTVGAYRVLQVASDRVADRTIPAVTDVVVGVRTQLWSSSGAIVSIRTSSGVELVSVYNNGGALEVRRGGTVLGVAGQSISSMRYVECLVRLAGAGADSCTLKVDGVVALTLTGLSLGAGPVELIRFGGGTYQTHWYIRDAAGLENPFYGPVLPRWLDAESDVLAQWLRVGAASNAAAVKAPHNAARYTEDQTLGHRDEYNTTDLPPDVNSIIAVVRCTVSSAPSGGAPQIQQGVRTSGGTVMGPERTVGISGPRTQCGHAMTQKPGGGGWSRAAVNELVMIREAV